MVRSITADGRLLITPIGGPLLPTLDGEYCRIYTRKGQVYTGTVLSGGGKLGFGLVADIVPGLNA